MKRVIGLIMLSSAAVASHAQVADQIRRATLSGSQGTSGRCTIEVRVDGSAEVDVYGDTGRLRTIAGQPATWTRMECTGPLPYNMSDFRFRGIDGRGNVRLVQDPRNNNSTAVVRIDDPRGGSEGYTFAIDWSGASGGYPTGGFATTATRSASAASGSTRLGRTAGRRSARTISAERAIDLCRNEVRTRAARDYNLRNIEIIAAGVDTTAGRGDWVIGSFARGRGARRANAFRFNCGVDYSSGQVHTVELLRADGSAVPLSNASDTDLSVSGVQTGTDDTQVLRGCQDAVVARTARDGYQNVNFTSTAMDTGRTRVSGSVTANRGPVRDTFDFSCSMNAGTATVSNLQLTRR